MDNNYNILKELDKLLKKIKYYEIITIIFQNLDNLIKSLNSYSKVKLHLKRIDYETRDIFEFFFIGETINKNKLLKCVSIDLLNFLISKEIIIEIDSGYRLNDYIILPIYNKLFLVGNHFFPTSATPLKQPIFNKNTIDLINYLQNINFNDEVLDIFCGFGLKTILLNPYCDKIVSIAENKECYDITKFNLYLNGLNDKELIIYTHNIYLNKQFDIILYENYFVPYVQTFNVKHEDILISFLKNNEKFLNHNGKIIIIGEALGKNDFLNFEGFIKTDNKLSYDLIIYKKGTINKYLSAWKNLNTNYLSNSNFNINRYLSEYDGVYSYLMYAKKVDNAENTKFLLRNWVRYDEKFKVSTFYIQEKNGKYSIRATNSPLVFIEKEFVEALKKYNDIISINDVVEFILNKKDSNLIDVTTILEKYSEIFDILLKVNIIERI